MSFGHMQLPLSGSFGIIPIGCWFTRWLLTLFPLNFTSTKFRDFRDFEKIAKFNTREIKDTQKLKLRNLNMYNINKLMTFKLLVYYLLCLSFMFSSILFDVVHQLSSTASLSLFFKISACTVVKL